MPAKTFALLALALVALTTACSALPGASPSPSAPPTPSTAPTASPAPTPTPSPTFGPDQIEHPTGALDIVLRYEVGGGFVPMNFLFTQSPTFTLYGDGTVILKPVDNRQGDPIGGQAFLPWVVGHLSEESVQSLLQYALGTGRLANAKDSYIGGCADCPTTVFTLNAGGMSKSVSILGLMEANDPSNPDAADRHGFNQLADVLTNFQSQSGVDLGDVTQYDPSHYKLEVLTGFGQPSVQPVAWPWDQATWDAWQPDPQTGNRTGVMSSELVAQLLDVPNGGHFGIWATAPDETVIQIAVRPMLPEEIDAFLHGGGG